MVQTRHLQRTKEILLAERLSQGKISRVLLALAEDLLGDPDKVARIPSALCDAPIRASESFTLRSAPGEERKPLFAGISEKSQKALGQAYEQLWLTRVQALCHPVPVAVYNAADEWFRKQTLMNLMRRPGVTFTPVWFLIAIHNWMWWRTHLEGKSGTQLVSRNGHETVAALKSRMGQDIDPFLALLEAGRTRPGDLVGMHIMLEQLQRWLMLRSGQDTGTLPGKQPVSAADAPDKIMEAILACLDARWSRILAANPITGLLEVAEPSLSVEQTQDGLRWRWLDTLLTDPGAKPLRKYLCAKLAQALSQQQTSHERVLHTLEQMAWLIPREFDAEDGWNVLLAQLLWTTLDSLQSEDLPALWERWAEEGEGSMPLARWCGRLAYRAEQVARHTPSRDLPDWVWTWYELAKVLLGRWLVGRGQAISCLGLWLEGYTDAGKTPPPLTLGRRACGYSLDHIIIHWLSVSRVVTSRLYRHYQDAQQQEAFAERLGRLTERLRQIPVVADYAVEEAAATSPLETAVPGPSCGEDGVDQWPAQVKIYRYASGPQDEGG